MGEAKRRRQLELKRCPDCNGMRRVLDGDTFAGYPTSVPCPKCTTGAGPRCLVDIPGLRTTSAKP